MEDKDIIYIKIGVEDEEMITRWLRVCTAFSLEQCAGPSTYILWLKTVTYVSHN